MIAPRKVPRNKVKVRMFLCMIVRFITWQNLSHRVYLIAIRSCACRVCRIYFARK